MIILFDVALVCSLHAFRAETKSRPKAAYCWLDQRQLSFPIIYDLASILIFLYKFFNLTHPRGILVFQSHYLYCFLYLIQYFFCFYLICMFFLILIHDLHFSLSCYYRYPSVIIRVCLFELLIFCVR